MILAQAVAVQETPVHPFFIAATILPLFALAVISVLGLPVLLIAKWGRWRLLFTALAPLTLASMALTFVATLMHDQFAFHGAEMPSGIAVGAKLGVVTSVGLLLTCAVVAIAGLVDKRRWGVLAVLVGGPAALFAVAVVARFNSMQAQHERVLNSMQAQTDRVRSQAAAVIGEQKLIESAPARFTAEAADDAGFTIDLSGDAATEETRPAWIDEGPGPGQEVLTAGPTVSRDQCLNEANARHLAWVWEQVHERHPGLGLDPEAIWLPRTLGGTNDVLARFQAASFLEKRSTSVGEVYLQYVLAQAPEADVAWLAERLAAHAKQQYGSPALVIVALGSGAVVGLVGLLHLLLRGGERPIAEEGA